jgi:hypothetical protein
MFRMKIQSLFFINSRAVHLLFGLLQTGPSLERQEEIRDQKGKKKFALYQSSQNNQAKANVFYPMKQKERTDLISSF